MGMRKEKIVEHGSKFGIANEVHAAHTRFEYTKTSFAYYSCKE